MQVFHCLEITIKTSHGQDYYSVLGVSKNANKSEIKSGKPYPLLFLAIYFVGICLSCVIPISCLISSNLMSLAG